MNPSTTALVLGGGGAKGAYQVGVFSALSSLGILAGQVYGTSVGALNAAMYAQGSLEAARALWHETRLENIVSKDSAKLASDIEQVLDHPVRIPEFVARHAKKQNRRFVDVTPLSQIIHQMVNETLLRSSPVRFGLVATHFPDLAPVEKKLEDMTDGTLCDWLLASSACFPIFPVATVEGHHYIDGGYSDNTPVAMALRSGAQNIIAVDIGKVPAHKRYLHRPNITYIRSSRPLGSTMAFDPAHALQLESLGYNDTMRAYGRVRGVQYSFDAADAAHLRDRANEFVGHISRIEARFSPKSVPLFDALEKAGIHTDDATDCYLGVCEMLAESAELDPIPVYTMQRFLDALVSRLPLEKSISMVDSLVGGRIGALMKNNDRLLVITCLYQFLRRAHTNFPLASQIVSRYPREYLCAELLYDLLS